MLTRLSLLSLAGVVALACGDDTKPSSPASGGAGGESADAGASTGGSSTPGEGGAGGMPEEWGPLELVGRSPEPDAAGVWFYDPITLTFTNPLDQATVTSETVRVTIEGEPQAGTLDVSPDGRVVTLRLTTPPIMAATATVEVSADLRDERGGELTGESWSYRLPLWQTSEADDEAATQPVVALDDQDRPLVASVRDGEVHVRRLEGGVWVALGQALNPGGSAAGAPAIAFDSELGPLVAYVEGGDVQVAAWADDSWSALSEPVATSGDDVALAVSTGGPYLALRGPEGIEVYGYDGEFAEIGSVAVAPAALGGFALAVDGITPLVAYYDDAPRVSLVRLLANGSADVTARVPLAELPPGAPALYAAGGEAYVAYVDSDGISYNAFVRVLAPGDDVLEPYGSALDLSLDADASTPRVGASAGGGLTVTWLETRTGVTRLYAARSNDGRLQYLGPALVARQTAPEALGLAVDSHGNANVVYADEGVTLSRYNGSPQAPFGLSARSSTASCAVPAEDTPTTLTATGCYADVAGHEVMAAALPFEINTELWSDGALKRRFIVLPDETTITVPETGAWKFPIGTIIIKEFWYEKVAGDRSTAFPMETRFLVKRCEETDGCANPLEGYSYRWNEEGTEATLLTDLEAPPGTGLVVKWPVTSGGDVGEPGVHSHTYPSRAQCVRCHNPGAGRFLGLQTPQLNRSAAFDNSVDNQLRTFEAIGVFDKPLSAGGADAKARLPSSHDPAFTLQERALAYFHANCSHCHNPQGEQPSIDFRFYGGAGLTATNICNKLVPGNSASSLIYTRDSTRPGMPPIATLAIDPRELPVTAAWIDSMTACPEP